MRTAIRNQKISLQKGIKSPKRMAALLVVLAMLLSLLLSGSLSFAEIEEGGTIPDSQKYTVTFVDEDGTIYTSTDLKNWEVAKLATGECVNGDDENDKKGKVTVTVENGKFSTGRINLDAYAGEQKRFFKIVMD